MRSAVNGQNHNDYSSSLIYLPWRDLWELWKPGCLQTFQTLVQTTHAAGQNLRPAQNRLA